MAATKEQELKELKALLSADEVIEPGASTFFDESRPFALQKDFNPGLVVRPKTLESLSKTVKFLGNSNLDFKFPEYTQPPTRTPTIPTTPTPTTSSTTSTAPSPPCYSPTTNSTPRPSPS